MITQQSKRIVPKGKRLGHTTMKRHSHVRSRTGGRSGALRSKEQRQLLQLVICGSVFVLLVTVKLLMPAKMAAFRETLSDAMERNMDVKAVFSAIGSAFSEEKELEEAAEEVFQAVLYPQNDAEAMQTGVLIPEADSAIRYLRPYRISETAQDEAPITEEIQVSSLAYVLYSDQNLPACVSMEQVILDFAYCTPLCAPLSSGFGYREHPTEGEERFHYGIDLAADTGTDILSFADGTVKAVGESSSYGKYCMVEHDGGYSTLYAHCSRITVSSGTEVSRGEKLAEVGESGMATGPHLHFEIQRDGTYLNPIYYVETA